MKGKKLTTTTPKRANGATRLKERITALENELIASTLKNEQLERDVQSAKKSTRFQVSDLVEMFENLDNEIIEIISDDTLTTKGIRVAVFEEIKCAAVLRSHYNS